MKKYSMHTQEPYEVTSEEDELGDWIHIDDFETFVERLEKSINEYSDEKNLISSKFVKIAIERCRNESK